MMKTPPQVRGLEPEAEALISRNSFRLVADRMKHYATPDENLTAATWADKYRHLPAGGRYRRWDTNRTPYMYEIAEVMASEAPEHRYIAISKSSQLGLTALATNELLRRIHTAPTSMMYFREVREKIEEHRRTMMMPSLRLPPFSGRRDIKVIGDDYYFPGGYLICNGTGSSNSVAGTTAQVVIGDEVAKFAESLGQTEGDFFSLASQRTSTFERPKAILFSTPKEKSENEGSFYMLVQRGDCRMYSCPCRHCKKDWFWEPEQIVKYEQDGDDYFALKCPHCSKLTRDGHEREDAMQNGKWLPTKEARPGFVSFEVSGMLSWRSLEDIYHFLEDAVAGRGAMAAFENTIAGRFYDPPEARRATPNELRQRMTKQIYKQGVVPDEVCVLTMAVDVQHRSLPWEVRGWANRFENWSVDRGTLRDANGELLTIDKTQDVMVELRKLLSKDWTRQDGKVMRIRLAGIDYGGPEGTAPAVRALLNFFPRINYDDRNVFIPQGTLVAVKGINAKVNQRLVMHTPYDRTATGQVRRSPAFYLGVDRGKFELYRAAKAPEDSEEVIFGTPHAPVEYPDEYYEELVAEEVLVERNPKDGRVIQFFRNPPGRRNEALDLWVYSRACAEIMRADQWTPEDWLKRQKVEVKKPGDAEERPEHMTETQRARKALIEKRMAEMKRRREQRMD